MRRADLISEKIVSLGKLSNRNVYEYSEEEIEKLFTHLQQVLEDTRERFAPKASSKAAGFSFDE